MMKLNLPIVALSPILLLVSIGLLLHSCNSPKTQNKENEPDTDTIEVDQEKYKYDKNKVLKTLNLSIEGEKYTATFLLDSTGELGDMGFEKYIDVLILKEEKLIEKMEFANPSILCNIDIEENNIQLIEVETGQKNVIFSILESCDGEEPDNLRIILWNGKKNIYNYIIPKFFDDDDKKEQLIASVSESNKAITFYIKENIKHLISDR